MEVIVLQSDAYYKLLNEMKEAFKEAIREEKSNAQNSNFDWVCKEEAKKLLGVKSHTTMQKFRDEQLIVFSQSGKTIKYSRKSIDEYLNKNAIGKRTKK